MKKRRLITPEEAAEIQTCSSIKTKTKEESENDKMWVLEVKIPFSVLKKFVGEDFKTPPGKWRANFYRCGGKTDPQYSTWSPITGPDRPYLFHQPRYFGILEFENE